MNWLLKIVEGPMKGAEIALVGGRRTSFGSGDDCDIVIADLSLAAKAFELDVSDTAVTVLMPGTEARSLRPFEVQTFGTTAIAVGPADQAWGELTYPRVEEEKEPEPAVPETAPEEVAPAAVAERKSGRSGCLWGIVVLLLLLLISAGCAWFFWGRIVARCPQIESTRQRTLETVKGWWDTATGTPRTVAAEPVAKGPSLKEIATQHGLVLSETDGVRKLSGNVRRRTERLAIRALALADDPRVAFDLTDDETLLASAGELLFVVTEGAVKATAASNRVVTLTGYAPSKAQFEKVVRALNADVPGIERLETTAVRIGGTPPVGSALGESAATEEGTTIEMAAPPQAPVKIAARKDYPIAGILMQPYPCVVMRDGLRLAEGAQVGTATIVRIQADGLVLKEGKTEFEWKP